VVAAVLPSSMSAAVKVRPFSQAVASASDPVNELFDKLPLVGSVNDAVTVTVPVPPTSVMLQPLRVATLAPGALSVLGSATVRLLTVVLTVGASSNSS